MCVQLRLGHLATHKSLTVIKKHDQLLAVALVVGCWFHRWKGVGCVFGGVFVLLLVALLLALLVALLAGWEHFALLVQWAGRIVIVGWWHAASKPETNRRCKVK